MPRNTTGGEIRFIRTRRTEARAVVKPVDFDEDLSFCPCVEDGVACGFMYPTKLRGAQRRPINNEREKLRVASVDRKRPRRRREKDLRSRYCCGFGGYHWRVMTAKMIGKTELMSVKPRAAELRY